MWSNTTSLPRKHYATLEQANAALALKADLDAQKPPVAVFPPVADDVASLKRQASIYAETDLWGGRFRDYREAYVAGFVEAYQAGETGNHYRRKNMYDLTDAEMNEEAKASGRARASYVLNLAKQEKINFVERPLAYYGDVDYPFADLHMLHNPIKAKDEIVIPAGTPYTTTGKEGKGVTKRATRIKVNHSNGGYTDGSVGKRFVVPPQVTAAGTGGYWKNYTVTPDLLERNNLPVHETLKTGMMTLKDEHEI